MVNFDAVVVSDLHLGARNSRGTNFLRFLHTIRCQRLVLAGDLFND
jgi:UDP-2,3-diacylglucosamine pyrophosphatase LpxH